MRISLVIGLVAGLMAANAYGQADALKIARAKVSTVYKRLASVPATAAEIETWAAAYIAAGSAAEKRAALATVAAAATASDFFYSRTVMNFADPETNEGEELKEKNLSDYTATIVGLIRDEGDYRRILYDDVIYIPTDAAQFPYSTTTNQGYSDLEDQVTQGQLELSASLTQSTQTAVTGLPVQAGIYTTRGYGSVYYNDGTNRAPFRYTYIQYLCRDIEEVSDVSRPDIYVRRDVDRTPGGDGEKFRTECVGCHAGMDPQTKAFAFLDWAIGEDEGTGNVTYTANAPVPKVNRNNDTFPNGAPVEDDAWLNIWYEGSNSSLGWSTTTKSGTGPKSWGQAMSETTMFPECMAERVYKTVCLRDNSSNLAKADIATLAQAFVADGHNMKKLFQNAAVTCGDTLNVGVPSPAAPAE